MSSRFFLFALVLLPFISVAQSRPAQRIIRDENLRAGQTYHWSNDTLYLLEGLVQLEAGGVLQIEEGTVIKGRTRPLIEGQPAALLIHAGADIIAKGRPTKPIIFTAEVDDLNDPLDLGKTDRGLWGGLIILGRGRLAAAQGLQRLPGIYAAQYGGVFDDDNSGALRYVSVRHAGAPFNGLTSAGIILAGVGEKTDLNYLEASSCQGDGIQILGGKAILNYTTVSFCSDDQFDWDQGWRGKGSYWFSIQAEDQADCTLEGKGGVAKNVEDLSLPHIEHFTFLGPGKAALDRTPSALRLSNKSGLVLRSGLIVDFPNYVLDIEDLPGEDDAFNGFKTSRIWLAENFFWQIGKGPNTLDVIRPDPRGNLEDYLLFAIKLEAMRNEFDDPIIFNISREQDKSLKPGDFAGNTLTNWWIGYWTALAQEDYLCQRAETIAQNIAINCNTDSFPSQFLNPLIDVRANNSMNSCVPNGNVDPSPQTASLVKRDRVILRIVPDSLPVLRTSEAYCWREVWQTYYFLFEPDEAYPIDTILYTNIYLVADTTRPIMKLEPDPNAGAVPFKVLTFDCDTSWIDRFEELRIDVNTIRYTWTARDYCGNVAQLNIDKKLNQPNNVWYIDRDGDTWGDAQNPIVWPNAPIPGQFVQNKLDCNDFSPHAQPGGVEDPEDALDNDCNGQGGHDFCSEALELVPNQWIFMSVANSTPTLSLPLACPQYFDREVVKADVWAKFNVPAGVKSLTINLNEGFDLPPKAFEIYRGSCENLNFLSCTPINNYYPTIIRDLSVDETLYFRFIGGDTGAAIFLSLDLAENDLCKNAPPLLLPYCENEETPASATLDKDAPNYFQFDRTLGFYTPRDFYGDIWYKIKAPASGKLVISKAELYKNDCAHLTLIQPKSRSGQDFFSFLYEVEPFQDLLLRQFVDNQLKKMPFCVTEVYDPSLLGSPPPNDECLHATVINEETYNVPIPFNSLGASNTAPNNPDQFDTWFTYSRSSQDQNIVRAIQVWNQDSSTYNKVKFELFIGTCKQLISINEFDLRFLLPGQKVFIRVFGNFSKASITLLTDKTPIEIIPTLMSRCYSALECRQKVDLQFTFSLLDLNECLNQGNPRIKVDLLEKRTNRFLSNLINETRTEIPSWPSFEIKDLALEADTFTIRVSVLDACNNLGSAYFSLIIDDCSSVTFNTLAVLSRSLQTLSRPADLNEDGKIDVLALQLKVDELTNAVNASCDAPSSLFLYRQSDLHTYNIFLPNKTLRPEWRPNPANTHLWFTCQDQGQSIPLALVVVDRFGKIYWKEIILQIAAAGSICNPSNAARLTGTVEQLNQIPLADVSIRLRASQLEVLQKTNQQGNVQFSGLPTAQAFEVIPSKPYSPSKELGLADILALSNHLLGKAPLTDPLLRLKADVNGDGIISLPDLTLLRARVVGLIDSFPRMPDWRFIPLPYQPEQLQSSRLGSFAEKAIVSTLNAGEAKMLRFLALRVGDLSTLDSKDFTPAGELPLSFQFSTDQLSSNVVQDVHLRIAKPLASTGVLASFHANSALIQILGAQLSSPDVTDQAAIHLEQDRLKVLWLMNNASEITDTLDIVLRCKSLQTAQVYQAISLDANPAQSITYDHLGTPFRLRASSNTGRLLWVTQNHPNPFDLSTLINFSLSQATQVLIKVFGVDGRTLLYTTQTYPAGVSSFIIDANTLPQPGVYFYQLQAGSTLVTKRMILIK